MEVFSPPYEMKSALQRPLMVIREIKRHLKNDWFIFIFVLLLSPLPKPLPPLEVRFPDDLSFFVFKSPR